MNRNATYFTDFLTDNGETWVLEMIPALNTDIGTTRTRFSNAFVRKLTGSSSYNVLPHKLPTRSSLSIEFDANSLTDDEAELLNNEVYEVFAYTPPQSVPVLQFDYDRVYALRDTERQIQRSTGVVVEYIPSFMKHHINEYRQSTFVYEENPYDGSKDLIEYETAYGLQFSASMPNAVFGVVLQIGSTKETLWFKMSASATLVQSSVFETWQYGNVWRVIDESGKTRFLGSQKRTPGTKIEHREPQAILTIEVVSIERSILESIKAEALLARLVAVRFGKCKRIKYDEHLFQIDERDSIYTASFAQVLSAIEQEATENAKKLLRSSTAQFVLNTDEIGVELFYANGAVAQKQFIGVQIELSSNQRKIGGLFVAEKDKEINIYDTLNDLLETLFVKARVNVVANTITCKTKRLLNSFDAETAIDETKWTTSSRTVSIGEDCIRGTVCTATMPHQNDKKKYVKAQNTSERESDVNFHLPIHNIPSFNDYEHTALLLEHFYDNKEVKALQPTARVYWSSNESHTLTLPDIKAKDKTSAVYLVQEESGLANAIAQASTECFGWSDITTVSGSIVTSNTINTTCVGNVYGVDDKYITHSPRKATLISCDEDFIKGTAKITLLVHHAE